MSRRKSKLVGVNVGEIANEITKQLSQYSTDVDKATKLAVNKVARDVNKEITSHAARFNAQSAKIERFVMVKINGHAKRVAIKSGRSKGKYVGAFKVKTIEDVVGSRKKVWYVKSPYHTLAHLLENGHKYNVNGKSGKTQAYPHIKYGEELAKRELPLEIEKRIKKIK